MYYGQFMSRLSSCIFEWDGSGIKRPMSAKEQEIKNRRLLSAKEQEIKNRRLLTLTFHPSLAHTGVPSGVTLKVILKEHNMNS